MCGIVGIINKDPKKPNLLEKMLLAQKHRGPDAMKSFYSNDIALGHNRLSIIDLTSMADQPMTSNCGRYTIVFNGEIYNYLELKKSLITFYQFKTHSDTEVLLALYLKYGKTCLNLLNGMFSFAIWDELEKKIFLSRDRFGVKPLYYAIQDQSFVFASEIKSIWAYGIPKLKNNKVWSNYLKYATYGLPYETFWEEISQLPAGHFIEFSLNDNFNFKSHQWYNFIENINSRKLQNINQFKEEYVQLLNDAIQLRFRSEVPLGMNVSGGLDSSLLIGLIHKNLPIHKNIEAFTFYCNDERYDELPWVESLLSDKPFHLNKVLLDYKVIPDLITLISKNQDEPFGGFPTLAYSLIFNNASSKGIKVLLDGQGMDEAWAGYDYYHNNSQNVIQGLKSSPVRPGVITEDFLKFSEKEIYPTPFISKLKNMQFRDIFYTKIPRALRFNDRISMLHGTELREPFLDYRLVELAFAQEDDFKYKEGNTKWMLREMSREMLSNSIALAPKRPLQTPQREWISNELRGFFDEKINEFSQLEFVHSKEVKKEWNNYILGNQENSFYIWQWINLVELLK